MAQGLGIMIVLLLALVAHLLYRPYEKNEINKLEYYSILTLNHYVAGGILFGTDISDFSKEAIGWILFTMNLVFLVYWAKFFCRALSEILKKSGFYLKFRTKLSKSFRKKIEPGNCSQKAKDEENNKDFEADQSGELFCPQNSNNSVEDYNPNGPRINVWTVKYG